jgi:hypothetical protein
MRWWWLCCAAIGCSPRVLAPVDAESDSGEDSRTGPMSDPGESSSSPSEVSTHVGTSTGSLDCNEQVELGPLPMVVALLVDQSGTMVGETLDHDGVPDTPEITRWNLLIDALEAWLPSQWSSGSSSSPIARVRGYAFVESAVDVVEFCGPACAEFKAQDFAYFEALCP